MKPLKLEEISTLIKEQIKKYEKVYYDVSLYVCNAHNGNGG